MAKTCEQQQVEIERLRAELMNVRHDMKVKLTKKAKKIKTLKAALKEMRQSS